MAATHRDADAHAIGHGPRLCAFAGVCTSVPRHVSVGAPSKSGCNPSPCVRGQQLHLASIDGACECAHHRYTRNDDERITGDLDR